MRALLIYGSYRLLGGLFGPLPPRLGYWLAHRIGILLYYASPRLRHTLADNMRHVLGPGATEKQVRALTRELCVNIAKGHYELFRVSRLTPEEIRRMVRIEGIENLQAAKQPGKGVILVSAHVGNVDIVIQAPLAYGISIMGPTMRVQPERLFRYILKLRQSHGVRLIPIDGPLLEVVRALKRGELVGLPCDRVIAESTRVVEFFGTPTRLPDGPVRLALRTGATLLPAFARRLADDSFVIQIEPPLELRSTGDREADIASGMEQIVRAMERHIAQSPGQWLIAAPLWPAAAD
ncbi:MAG TPA: lysophospholipid acyltransferase family protein [Anaerolineae bacterium]|nr:lysophospholipid acyltransferase family protein [Anaerolineae bacterium]